jgi:membrane protein YdbS with pleckstrin-like domain
VFGAIAIGFICVFAYARNQGKLASAVTTVNTYTPHLTTYIILILGLVLFIISVVHSVLWKNRFAFVFLPDFISIQQGVIGREEKSLPYNTIQDVTVRQGVWERLCGVASVYIQNAAPSVTAMGGGRQGMPVFNGIIIPGQTFERANTLASTLKKILTTQDSRHTGV